MESVIRKPKYASTPGKIVIERGGNSILFCLDSVPPLLS